MLLPGTRHATTEPFDPEPRSIVSELFQENVWLLPVGRSTLGSQVLELVFHDNPPKKADQQAEIPSRDAQGYPKRGVDIPGPPPRAPRKEDRTLTDYEKQLLREIQELKNRQEMMVAPAPPPPKYSDSVDNWQKDLETVTCGRLGLF